jgi:uncharacterized membrane protein YphA (DoxX/SURF4 family)
MTLGVRLFGLSTLILGLVGLGVLDWGVLSHIAPGQIAARPLVALAGAVVLVCGGVAMNLGRRTAGIGALGVAAWFAYAAATGLWASPSKGWTAWAAWQNAAEFAAMGLGALTAWALCRASPHRITVAFLARIVFGYCLIVFGVSHFVYLRYTAALVPAWLPPGQTLWAQITGAAQIAAGLAMISGVRAWLAAVLLTAMYAIFGLLVHLPMLMHAPRDHFEWIENATNLTLLAAAWCVAEALRRRAKIAVF